MTKISEERIKEWACLTVGLDPPPEIITMARELLDAREQIERLTRRAEELKAASDEYIARTDPQIERLMRERDDLQRALSSNDPVVLPSWSAERTALRASLDAAREHERSLDEDLYMLQDECRFLRSRLDTARASLRSICQMDVKRGETGFQFEQRIHAVAATALAKLEEK